MCVTGQNSLKTGFPPVNNLAFGLRRHSGGYAGDFFQINPDQILSVDNGYEQVQGIESPETKPIASNACDSNYREVHEALRTMPLFATPKISNWCHILLRYQNIPSPRPFSPYSSV